MNPGASDHLKQENRSHVTLSLDTKVFKAKANTASENDADQQVWPTHPQSGVHPEGVFPSFLLHFNSSL